MLNPPAQPAPLPVALGGTGTGTAFTTGSIVFIGSAGVYAQDNANLFWDDTLNRLGIGTNLPTELLDVNGNARVNGIVKANRVNVQGGAASVVQVTAGVVPLTDWVQDFAINVGQWGGDVRVAAACILLRAVDGSASGAMEFHLTVGGVGATKVFELLNTGIMNVVFGRVQAPKLFANRTTDDGSGAVIQAVGSIHATAGYKANGVSGITTTFTIKDFDGLQHNLSFEGGILTGHTTGA
jgi:hypothetical protein